MSGEYFSSQAKVKRRDKLAILSAILLHADKGVYKTELMYRVGLSSAQVGKYIRMLVRPELLEVSKDSKKTVYKTTKKGKRYVDVFCTLVKLLD